MLFVSIWVEKNVLYATVTFLEQVTGDTTGLLPSQSSECFAEVLPTNFGLKVQAKVKELCRLNSLRTTYQTVGLMLFCDGYE